ncbi:hypothetical protein OEZ71_17690 [Defluviimonas sp. WL0050]|uniref:Uncharacterized protein n=1 Tax=Albidovulum litorale TaxID=2984134 RepID=A0ABT2ZSJ3_9RHOB|nr:hypothetical protein [Defluviimonas sp. WL0050]MCV2874134.1 hypothetical protein [Defluviimonas sp. WL0050]
MRFRSFFRKSLVDVVVVVALFVIVESLASIILFSRPASAGSPHTSATAFADRPGVFASGPAFSPSP